MHWVGVVARVGPQTTSPEGRELFRLTFHGELAALLLRAWIHHLEVA